MILWQANLGRGVTVDEFERNLVRVLEASGPRAVICFQEIDEADLPKEMDITVGLTRGTHRIVGAHTAVPILVPLHLPVVTDARTRASDGLAGFTPHRVVNEATIRLGPDLAPIVLNTHLPINRPQTATRRKAARQALRRRTVAHEAGVWVADTNTRYGWPRIHPDEVAVTNAGIDKAKAWGPADRVIEVTDQQTVELSIDGHNAHGARVIWRRTDA